MAHHLTLAPVEVTEGEVRVTYQQVRCSCGWAGARHTLADEAVSDAKTHAAVHGAVLQMTYTP